MNLRDFVKTAPLVTPVNFRCTLPSRLRVSMVLLLLPLLGLFDITEAAASGFLVDDMAVESHDAISCLQDQHDLTLDKLSKLTTTKTTNYAGDSFVHGCLQHVVLFRSNDYLWCNSQGKVVCLPYYVLTGANRDKYFRDLRRAALLAESARLSNDILRIQYFMAKGYLLCEGTWVLTNQLSKCEAAINDVRTSMTNAYALINDNNDVHLDTRCLRATYQTNASALLNSDFPLSVQLTASHLASLRKQSVRASKSAQELLNTRYERHGVEDHLKLMRNTLGDLASCFDQWTNAVNEIGTGKLLTSDGWTAALYIVTQRERCLFARDAGLSVCVNPWSPPSVPSEFGTLSNATDFLVTGTLTNRFGVVQRGFGLHVFLLDKDFNLLYQVTGSTALSVLAPRQSSHFMLRCEANPLIALLGLVTVSDDEPFSCTWSVSLKHSSQLYHRIETSITQLLASTQSSYGNHIDGDLNAAFAEARRRYEQCERHKDAPAKTTETYDTLLDEGARYMRSDMLDLERARQAYQKAITLDPKIPNAYHNLGLVYLRMTNFVQCAPFFERALAQDPTFADSHLALGIVYERQRDLPKAIEHYQLYLEVAPNGLHAATVRDWVARHAGTD